MNFLYVVLGLAMISGITAMMKIGNNLNNLVLLSTFKESDYFESSLPIYDRRILDVLENYSGPDKDVCSNIKQKISDSFYEDGELRDIYYEDGDLFLSTGTQSPSVNSLFTGSCALVNKNLNHRVIINKDKIGNFNLFSCYLKDQPYCPYEINK